MDSNNRALWRREKRKKTSENTYYVNLGQKTGGEDRNREPAKGEMVFRTDRPRKEGRGSKGRGRMC